MWSIKKKIPVCSWIKCQTYWAFVRWHFPLLRIMKAGEPSSVHTRNTARLNIEKGKYWWELWFKIIGNQSDSSVANDCAQSSLCNTSQDCTLPRFWCSCRSSGLFGLFRNDVFLYLQAINPFHMILWSELEKGKKPKTKSNQAILPVTDHCWFIN